MNSPSKSCQVFQATAISIFVLFSFLLSFFFPSNSTQQITFLRSLTSSSDVKRTRLSQMLFVTFVKRADAFNANIGSVIDIEDFDRNNKHNLRNNLQVYRFLKPSHGSHQKNYICYTDYYVTLRNKSNTQSTYITTESTKIKFDQSRIDFSSLIINFTIIKIFARGMTRLTRGRGRSKIVRQSSSIVVSMSDEKPNSDETSKFTMCFSDKPESMSIAENWPVLETRFNVY